jgi:hypothetical protein
VRKQRRNTSGTVGGASTESLRAKRQHSRILYFVVTTATPLTGSYTQHCHPYCELFQNTFFPRLLPSYFSIKKMHTHPATELSPTPRFEPKYALFLGPMKGHFPEINAKSLHSAPHRCGGGWCWEYIANFCILGRVFLHTVWGLRRNPRRCMHSDRRMHSLLGHFWVSWAFLQLM